MTTDNLNTFTAGNKIKSDEVEQNDFVIVGDIVPRNASGEPENRAGDIGTQSYKFKSIIADGTLDMDISAARDIDVYNFPIRYPYEADQLVSQPIYRAGEVIEIGAKLAGTTSSPGDVRINIDNIDNDNVSATILGGTGVYTVNPVTTSWSTTAPATADVVSGDSILALSIKQVGTVQAGELLNVYVQVRRT